LKSQTQIKGPLIRPSGTFSRKRKKGVVQVFLGRLTAKAKAKAVRKMACLASPKIAQQKTRHKAGFFMPGVLRLRVIARIRQP
jgi:hypothetical protein